MRLMDEERNKMKKWLEKIRWTRKPEDHAPLPPVFAKMLQVHILETTIKR